MTSLRVVLVDDPVGHSFKCVSVASPRSIVGVNEDFTANPEKTQWNQQGCKGMSGMYEFGFGNVDVPPLYKALVEMPTGVLHVRAPREDRGHHADRVGG